MTIHVVLATYGEPPTPSFVDQLAYSWRILLGLTRKVDAIPRPLLPVIALARAKGRRAAWREHRYGSPLEAITEAQARAMQACLRQQAPGIDWRVTVGYEYRPPLVGDVVRRLPAGDRVYVVPMYAAESAFTHELTREAIGEGGGRTVVLGALPLDTLAEISAAHIRRSLGDDPSWRGKGVALVLAAHGTVLEPPKPIDTGLVATEALCNDIHRRLAGEFGLVVNGWLNHTRGGRWTEPPIEQALQQVVDAGFKRAVYYPYGFLGDNAESELEGRVALAHTGLEARHLPCLNDAPILIERLAQQVLASAGAGTPRVSSAAHHAVDAVAIPAVGL